MASRFTPQQRQEIVLEFKELRETIQHLLKSLTSNTAHPSSSTTSGSSLSVPFNPTPPPFHSTSPAPLHATPAPRQSSSRTTPCPKPLHSFPCTSPPPKRTPATHTYPFHVISPPAPLPFSHPHYKLIPPLTKISNPRTDSIQIQQPHCNITPAEPHLSPAPKPISIPFQATTRSDESSKVFANEAKTTCDAIVHIESCKEQNMNEKQAFMEQVSTEKVEKVAIEEPCSQISASLTLYITPPVPETIPPEPPPMRFDFYLHPAHVKVPQSIQPMPHSHAAKTMTNVAETVQNDVMQIIEKSNNTYKMTTEKHKRNKMLNGEDLGMDLLRKERVPARQYNCHKKNISFNKIFDLYKYHSPDELPYPMNNSRTNFLEDWVNDAVWRDERAQQGAFKAHSWLH